jgi:hypothetical protein
LPFEAGRDAVVVAAGGDMVVSSGLRRRIHVSVLI